MKRLRVKRSGVNRFGWSGTLALVLFGIFLFAMSGATAGAQDDSAPPAAPPAASPPPAPPTTATGPAAAPTRIGDSPPLFRDCEAPDEDTFRELIRTRTLEALRTRVDPLQIRPLVAAEWERQDIGERYAEIVVAEVEAARRGTGYWTKFTANYSPAGARELAEQVIPRVFNSRAFAALSEDLSGAVFADIVARMQTALAGDALRSSLAACLEGFLQSRYTDTVAQLFFTTSPDFETIRSTVEAEVGLSSTLSTLTVATGAALIVLRRVVANIVNRILMRVVGRVAARVAGSATVLVGLGLVGYDLWAAADGPFPAIESELLDQSTREGIIDSFADNLSREVETQMHDVALGASENLFRGYIDFKNANRTILSLIDSSPEFKALVGDLDPAQFDRLHDVVGILEAEGGREAILAALDRGLLRRAMSLPPAGIAIANDLGSLDAAIAWHERLPNALPRVVESGAHRRFDPREVPAGVLEAVFRLKNEEAVDRVLALGEDNARELSGLPFATFDRVVADLGSAELEGLAEILATVEAPAAKADIARQSLGSAEQRAFLSDPALRQAIAESPDKGVAVEAISSASWRLLPRHAGQVLDGSLTFGLFRSLYGWSIWVFAGAGILLLIFLIRLFRPPVRIVLSDQRKDGR